MIVATGILFPFLELKKYLNRTLDSDYIKFKDASGCVHIIAVSDVERLIDFVKKHNTVEGICDIHGNIIDRPIKPGCHDIIIPPMIY